ncbi:aryl hydrocarbon receptor repressor-like isoform X1 [Acipenser oxyrinchus oxyrinchus]|uniref:Aryl hydrocarbon receptor repressor n=1 Tax=Acipenser oxyrinchus oxyrinchus TaxID=40147 RepID=A0AAD8LQH2_ACIOX|nr:aryl hydrocarbon receptor repressor-like isoform X1 [Acipenser oxyrinchus oxyrinchus]
MIPPGDCMYAGRKRRKPIQKQKQGVVSEKSNPSKRHRDRLNAELDRLASLLPFSPDIISKLDKLSILRLSVSYLRVKSFFQAIQEKTPRKHISQPMNHESRKESTPTGNSITESGLLLESLSGFALVVSTEGMIFYASSTIVDYLGFHQTDVMHQNVFDYIHVDDRQEFRRQLHWSMNPPQQVASQEHHLAPGTGEDYILSSLFNAQESDGVPPECSSFLKRCFISRVRCLLDSTSGFLTMQFQGRLKFLYGQKKRTASGAVLPPQLALFCVAVPVLLPSITEMKMKSMIMRTKHKAGVINTLENKAKGGEVAEAQCKNGYHYVKFADVMHNAETHLKVMNNGENGVPVFRVLTNEDQWNWVQANAQLVYRNGCPEYVIVTQQAMKEKEDTENLKTEASSRGTNENDEVHLLNCSSDTCGQQMHYNHWTKEGIKQKLELNKSEGCYSQNEPLNFCKSSLGGDKAHNLDNPWAVRSSIGAQLIRTGQNMNNLSSKPAHYGKPGIYKMSQSCQHIRNDTHIPKLYSISQNPEMDNFTADGMKSESTYESHVGCYSNGMFPETPIKVEQESDSENGCDIYRISQSRTWMCKEEVEKRFGNGYSEGIPLKTEADYYEQHSPCQKNKNNMGMPFNRQYQDTSSGSRPLKCVLPKDFTQFSPQRLPHLENLSSNPSANCLDSPAYGHNSVEHKGFGQQEYKLAYEFKSHNLIHEIKREPMDSPPWSDINQEVIQIPLQRNVMPNCIMNSAAHKSNPYSY